MYSTGDIETITKLIRKECNDACREIVLFGSYANGTARESSDLDLVVIFDEPLPRSSKLDLLNRLWWETAQKGYSVDLLIKAKQDFEREKTLPTISRVISREGRSLWKRN